MADTEYRDFYDKRRKETYGHDYSSTSAEDHSWFPVVKKFVDDYSLADKKCLEIGSSGGFFQDLVPDYCGTDIAHTLAKYYHKPYRVATGTRYPFDDESFDAI